jgi:hypothetical protein
MRWPFTINRSMSRCLGVSCGSFAFEWPAMRSMTSFVMVGVM